MDALVSNLSLGLETAVTWQNLTFCLVGVLLGTLIGVLPGIGSIATIAMLLPLTFSLPPTSALIMLAGIYYGAQYGGSTTAILVNIPGESSSIVTCIDGYALAKKGRAGAALAMAAIGSFVAGSITTLAIAIFGPLLTLASQNFSAAEYFSLMIFGLLCAIVLSRSSVLKAVIMTVLGLLMSMIGTDLISAEQRLTFGIVGLSDGIDFVALSMGLFGVSEVIANYVKGTNREILQAKVTKLMPTLADLKLCVGPILRGSVIGSLLGVLPGGGGVLSSFTSYSVEKKMARKPEEFGKGALQGVAGPEAANNSGAQASFIPLLALGIPSNAVMALMGGAMMIQGITPGPQVMTGQPTLFWGIIASMWIGNLMLLVINLPLVGIWVRLLKVPYRMLAPAILLFCCIGVFSVNNSVFDVFMMAFFGVIGYLLLKLECDAAPLLLAFILGPLIEENLRRALLLSRGDPMTFIQRPVSAALLAAATVLLVVAALPMIKARRRQVFVE